MVEPAEWARALVDVAPAGSPAAAAAEAAIASAASNRGEFAAAERSARRALGSDDPKVAASAHDTLANIGLYTGDLDVALGHAATLTELGERDGDTVTCTLGLVGTALALVYAGRIAEAQDVFDHRGRATGLSPTSAAWIAYTSGEVNAAAGRHDEAVREFDRAIELGCSVGSHFVASVARVSSLAAATRAGGADLTAFVPLLDEYRRSLSLTHGVTTLRNLVDAMVGAEMYEPAMVLLGALSNPEVKATYGPESALLGEARDAAVAAAGAAAVDRWTAVGAGHDVGWAIDHAIDVVTDLPA